MTQQPPTPRLQIALDTFDLPSALGPLQQAAPHVDVIECGTILVLCEGFHAVRAIRALFPEADPRRRAYRRGRFQDRPPGLRGWG